MKVFVIGVGLLGSKIVDSVLKRDMIPIAADYDNQLKVPGCEIHQLNKCNKEKVKLFIEQHRPDITIDTAAIHNVDACERSPEKSRKINVDGTRNVAEACKQNNSKMVFISTDYVFDGTKGDYREDNEPSPLSVYGKHKLEAEKIVLETNPNSLICRPSVMYGWGGPKDNFVTWLLNELKIGREVSIVNDQYNNPTFAADLANMILDLCHRGQSGVFHTTGSECVNRYEFANIVADIFSLDSKLINSIATKELNQVGSRPKKCCMNTDKISKIIGRKPMSCKEGLSEMKKTRYVK